MGSATTPPVPETDSTVGQIVSAQLRLELLCSLAMEGPTNRCESTVKALTRRG
jgi:hypothetical protein